jgi:hypothetical protein
MKRNETMPQDIKIKDMGIYPYGNVSHNVAKLLWNVEYPVAKAELKRRFGSEEVRVDFTRTMPFGAMLDKIPIDSFLTGTSFFTALHSTNF